MLISGRAVCTTEKLDEEGSLGSYRDRIGDPALIDSIDVAGDTPSDVYERRFPACTRITFSEMSINVVQKIVLRRYFGDYEKHNDG